MVKCPICDAEVAPRSVNPSFPFCTTRCKTIDLGKWVNEEYRIPIAEDAFDDGSDRGEGDAGASNGASDDASKMREDMRH